MIQKIFFFILIALTPSLSSADVIDDIQIVSEDEGLLIRYEGSVQASVAFQISVKPSGANSATNTASIVIELDSETREAFLNYCDLELSSGHYFMTVQPICAEGLTSFSGGSKNFRFEINCLTGDPVLILNKLRRMMNVLLEASLKAVTPDSIDEDIVFVEPWDQNEDLFEEIIFLDSCRVIRVPLNFVLTDKVVSVNVGFETVLVFSKAYKPVFHGFVEGSELILTDREDRVIRKFTRGYLFRLNLMERGVVFTINPCSQKKDINDALIVCKRLSFSRAAAFCYGVNA